MKPKSQVWMVAAAGVVGLLMGCTGSEKFNAEISYVLEPTQELPAGLTNIAVLDAGVETNGSEDDDRSKKWATIAADMIEKMIQDSGRKFGSGISVAKRRETTKILAEQDLKAAGMVDSSSAYNTGRLLGVQALVNSKINIRVEVKKGKARTVDALSIAAWGGHGWGGGRGSISTSEVEQISRNMTVQCSFTLMDATTGEAIVQYSPKPFRKLDTASPGPIFGSSKGEEDLDSVDATIGELVEQGTREFVSMFVPCEVDYRYELKSAHSKPSAAGVRALRADDFESAANHFKAALVDEPDDHRSAFCLGVTHELMRDWNSALKYYRRAAAMPDVDEDEMAKYLAAKNRISSHKDRIRKM